MRFDVVFVLSSFLGVSDALRRQCKMNPNHGGEGWYYATSIDTVENVAADFCTTPSVVRQWNNLEGELKPGMSVKVPCRVRRRDCRKNTPTDGAYVIVSGDDLGPIAEDFCTNADVLQAMNSGTIKNKDFILPGWVIQVPCSWN
ncbi:putative Ecp7(P20) [Fusarium bulbicola]|nr:putative Ecp7(P20) [Fusarium bulbicola]